MAEFLNLENESRLSIFIIFTDDELKQLLYGIKHHKILYTYNSNLIKQLMKVSFLNTGGDIVTVGSKIIICQGKDKIYESQILLNNNIGLQNQDTGWIEAVNKKTLIKIISMFEKYEYPILIK